MTIPKNIKVGGLTYEIQIVEDLKDAAGETDNQDLTIKIAKARPESMELTFLHELLHAINFEVGERDVEFYAMSLYQIIKDNPHVFKGGESLGNGKK